jgi:hypothetical protein
MVYLDTKGDIRHIFCNASSDDSYYVLKVYKDVPRKISVVYAQEYMYVDSVGEKIEAYERELNDNGFIHIDYRYNDGVLEEIRTYS